MASLTLFVGDHSRTVEVTPGEAYRATVSKMGQDFTVTLDHVAATPMIETGSCVAHREPLYDGSDMCSLCWDEWDAYMMGEEE